ncbi:MAG: hypothetical protein PHY69_09860 [Dysgonamonadaceae bacterium]|nr:hypothetical protein [Dysgonamonadaceae bacterium]
MKAIHNKDYSVVKTFKAAFGSLFYIHGMKITSLTNSRKNPMLTSSTWGIIIQ